MVNSASSVPLLEQRGAVLGAQQGVADPVGLLQAGGGQGGELAGDLRQGSEAAQVAAADAEDLPPLVQAQLFLQLGKRRLNGKAAGQLRQHLRLSLAAFDFPAGEKILEVVGAAAEEPGQEGGGAEDGEQPAAGCRLGQHRLEVGAGDGAAEALEVVQGEIGIGGSGGRQGNRGEQFPVGADLLQQPQVGGGLLRLGEAEFGDQRLQRLVAGRLQGGGETVC